MKIEAPQKTKWKLKTKTHMHMWKTENSTKNWVEFNWKIETGNNLPKRLLHE